jgi:class 3 adenylate cyclase
MWMAGVLVISVIHALALTWEMPLLSALTARLFLVPVAFAAVAGGLFQGSASGLAAALGLVSVMLLHTGHHHGEGWNATFTEHLIEAPFFVAFGAVTGFFRDHLQREQRRRDRAMDLFSRFVSPSVVEEIMARGAILEGEETEATVLFADVRGFTSRCEGMPPSEVFNLLNRFFGEMVAIVFAERGLLDKYIGDAVMAVFGVPIRSRDHAAHAVRAALAMIARLEELNAISYFGDDPIHIGIGIHTGPLMAGHVGCLERMEYTVMGDTVNVASRLQALTKEYGVPLLVSEATRAAVAGQEFLEFRELDLVKVRGRTATLRIHTVEPRTGIPAPPE